MSEQTHNDGKPAFPVPCLKTEGGNIFPVTAYGDFGGMSLRAYAAIKLGVPRSGIDWLDEMIVEAKRDGFAGQALAGILSIKETHVVISEDTITPTDTVAGCYKWADYMLEARKEKK